MMRPMERQMKRLSFSVSPLLLVVDGVVLTKFVLRIGLFCYCMDGESHVLRTVCPSVQ